MKQFAYTVTDPVGIHARPAGILVKEVKTLGSTVTIISKEGKSADALRLMAVMGLGIKCGDTLLLQLKEAAKHRTLHSSKPSSGETFDFGG